MAKYLKLGWLIVMILVLQESNATELRDPTLPPPQLRPSTSEETSALPVLQSVVLGSQIKYALISGQSVFLGKKYQDYKLVKLSPNEATLRDQEGKFLILKMDYVEIKKSLVK
jgi:hypothetical protein